MKKSILVIIAVVVAGGLLWLIFVARGDVNLPSADSVRPAPAFSLPDYEGNVVSLSDFSGTPLVVNSWAAWCPFCVDELPDFAEIQEEFGDRVVIIAIDRAEPLSTAKRFSDDLGVTGKMVLLLDPTDSFYQSIGGFSMPETIFVDSSGNTRFHKRGPMDIDEIRQRVNDLLEASS